MVISRPTKLRFLFDRNYLIHCCPFKKCFFFFSNKKDQRVIGQSIGGGIHTKSIVLESNNIAKIWRKIGKKWSKSQGNLLSLIILVWFFFSLSNNIKRKKYTHSPWPHPHFPILRCGLQFGRGHEQKRELSLAFLGTHITRSEVQKAVRSFF